MDRLFHAAQTGDIEELHQLLARNPLILHQVPLICAQNPLHFASAAGHLDFAEKILEMKPEFARQVNAEGYSPMHLASGCGHIQIAREMIRIDSNICRLEGKEGTTPLHLAVLGGRVDLIIEMLANCEGCIEDVTVQKDTALHLAVKSFQLESLQVLLDWTRQMDKEEILNRKDEHGNTILHLAIWKKQRKAVDLLLRNNSRTLEVNAINNSGLTARDLLLIFPSEAGDREIQEILQGAGALKAQELTFHHTTFTTSTDGPSVNIHSEDLVEYFRFHSGRDSPSDVRSALLVITVLVATATYQVGISPPGNVWQDDSQGHLAGTSVLGTHDLISYIILVSCNAIGFNVSLYAIATLTAKFPLQTELQICLLALYVTFNVAVSAISPKSAKTFTAVFTSVTSTIIPLCFGLLRKFRVFERMRRISCIFGREC
ncbi:ankyrin repeat-containing protein BDA1-like [Chenopodium quinoa]|uniref:ankyrin repeat-containing protein BDA1-like n=1 Tax=Chenopodium quinoa TaxID=63459 RepID=UPI000B79A7FA|nr:ankyrin repeat-containing protein BDA1-like [Chenopodium quinoa]